MLGFLLAVWGRELVEQLIGLARRRTGWVLLLILASTPLLGASWVVHRLARASEQAAALQFSTPGELPDNYPRLSKPAPALDLVNQAGETVSIDDFRGRPVLLTFAFAHCQTICPVLVQTLKGAARDLGEIDPAVVVVTLDPWRDTPSSLPTLYESWGLDSVDGSHVLSGEVDQVLGVLDAWDMPYARDPKTGDVGHPAMVHVLTPDGDIGYSFNGPTAAWLVEATHRTCATGC
jgi:protein SCO1/2